MPRARRPFRLLRSPGRLLLAAVLATFGRAPLIAGDERPEGVLRVATFNTSLSRDAEGELVRALSTPDDPRAQVIAETIQRVRPDVILLQELDHDDAGEALRLLRESYLEISQNGAQPIAYEWAWAVPSNTGVPTGLDLDRDGRSDGPGDAQGFGAFEGQYAMAVLSRHPIDLERIRTFRETLWRDLPGALLPDDPVTPEPADWYSPEALAVLRLSSKSHVDVPILVDGEPVHLLASHPTPPVFDGPEDRNGRRNHDELRFWIDYLDPERSEWIRDDAGVPGGLAADARFVLLGDLNVDPLDGDGRPEAIEALLANPRIDAAIPPRSSGAEGEALRSGGANAGHRGDPRFDTADFADTTPGNLRVDYILPSRTLSVADARVFWPAADDPLFRLVGRFPFPASDHRLVWADIESPRVEELPDGVAAGDVTTTSAVLWARASVRGELRFEWWLERAPEASRRSATSFVDDALVPAKLLVTDLRAGAPYGYRATDAAGATDTGGFRTLDPPGVRREIALGFTGDWQGELAPYPSIADVPEAGLDAFIVLGDTIYADYPTPRVPARQASTIDELRRKHDEVYRRRYGERSLAAARASTALFATYDDHEVTDDFAGAAPVESDARFDGAPGTRINESALFTRGIDAFVEYHPIEPLVWSDSGDADSDGRVRLYRHRAFGSLVALFVVDARTFRDEPVPPPDLTDPDSVAAYEIATFAPGRRFLGRAQLDALIEGLESAQRQGILWKLISIPEPAQELGPVAASDRYEGYAAERAELLAALEERGITDVVFVAADIHGTVVNDVLARGSPFEPRRPTGAFELTTGAVAFDAPFGPTLVSVAAEAGFLGEEELELYAFLPRSLKDAFLATLLDAQFEALGLDPIGLDAALPPAAAIDAELVTGRWLATHTFGWTELRVDPESGELRITTRGVDPWTEGELADDTASILARRPEVVSELVVRPRASLAPIADGFALSLRGPRRVIVAEGELTEVSYECALTSGPAEDGATGWSFAVRALGAEPTAASPSAVAVAYGAAEAPLALHEVVDDLAVVRVVLAEDLGDRIPPSSTLPLADVTMRFASDDDQPRRARLEITSGSLADGTPLALEVLVGARSLSPRITALEVDVATEAEADFLRGDVDQDSRLSVGDAVATFGHLFQGAPAELSCLDAADSDDSGRIEITDGIRTLGFLFLGNGPLPPPSSACGFDPTPDTLGCDPGGPCP